MIKVRESDDPTDPVEYRPNEHAIADLPYTTACSPLRITFPGAETEKSVMAGNVMGRAPEKLNASDLSFSV